jgi:hypothetical protein
MGQSSSHRRATTLVLGLAPLACGGSHGEVPTLDVGFAGATESFVWFGYDRLEVVPFPWLRPQTQCDGYEEIGNCGIPRRCPRPEPPPPSDVPPPIDPGQITVAGVPLVFDPSQNWSSASFSPLLPLGEPIGFTVAGSRDIPAHDGEFVLPAAITVLEPDTSTQVVVDRSRNLVVRWVPTDSGNVTAGIYDDFDPYVSVSCTAPAAAGEMEIPSEVLAMLPDSTALENGQASFIVFRDGLVTTVEAGSFTVRITAVGRDVRAQAIVN